MVNKFSPQIQVIISLIHKLNHIWIIWMLINEKIQNEVKKMNEKMILEITIEF